MKFTATLALVAATTFASKTAFKAASKAASKATSKDKSHVIMWRTGDAAPAPPMPNCYNEAAYWYKDDSNCWQAWDDYCGPNWLSDSNCQAIERAYKANLDGGSGDGGSGDDGSSDDGSGDGGSGDDGSGDGGSGDVVCNDQTIQIPAEACFTDNAWNYRTDCNGDTCGATWRSFDSYCGNRAGESCCTTTNAAYQAYIDENGDGNDCTGDVVCEVVDTAIPAETCFNNNAWSYGTDCNGETCGATWSSFDSYCGTNAGDSCCTTTNAAYQAYILENGPDCVEEVNALVMSSSKQLVLSKHAAASENNGFESGLAAGAAIGAVGAAAAFFVIKRCTNKAGVSDDFERI